MILLQAGVGGQSGVGGVQLEPSILFESVVVLLAAYLLARFGTVAISALAERVPRRRIAIKMFTPVLKFLIYGLAAYFIAGPLLQLSSTQVLAVSGLLGAALGFGLKDLFAGVIGGLVIITEKPYRVGDKVEIGDHYGEVTGIGLRSTTLTTADDTAVVVPNATMFSANVANANAGAPEMMVVVEVAVARSADVDRATDIVEEALITSKYVFVDDDHPVAVVVEDDAYYRTIKGKAYVSDLRDEFAFSSDVTERTLAAFEAEGIESPVLRAERTRPESS
ncbi:MAG: mechanosensitive ion channel family protein [Halopenitus sp.]